jgi:hypothetical protein
MAEARDRGPGNPPTADDGQVLIPAESARRISVSCAQLPAERIRALTLRQPWATHSLGVGIPLPAVAAAILVPARAADLWGCSSVALRCFVEGPVPGCLA